MWEPTERGNHVAERGLVPVNGGAVQREHDGAKKDGFVRRDQSWYVSSDIPSDLLVKVGGVNFHLHQHPMVSRSARLARLVDEASAIHGPDVVATAVELPDLPGGHGAFELAAKFCYGVMVDITAANVAALRCAAEYLEMTEELEEGNLAFRAEAFLAYVVASSWRDSVAVLRSCEGLSPWADDLHLVRRCSESVAAKACTSPRAVRWAYAGRRSPATPRTGTSTGSSQQPVPPADWWVEDICVLRIDHFVRIVTAVQAKGMPLDLTGAAVTRYASRWLPGLTKHSPSSHGGAPWTQAGGLQMVIAGDGEDDTQTASEQRMVVESLISIIPLQRDCVSCGFLLRLLRLAVMLKAAPALVTELEKRVGMQLEQAALPDLLVPSYSYGRADTAYDVDLLQRLVEQFLVQEQSATASSSGSGSGRRKGEQEQQNAKASRVACLLDSYLSEVSRDRNLAVSKFQVLAESLPESARACDDGLYRAIDSYLKAHPAMTEHERKRLCRAVDCGKLSVEARTHAAQNERLPLRVAVQVLLSEQVKIADALAKADTGDGSSSGKKKKDVNALRLEVESVNGKYMELQREVELLQKQVELLLSASAPAAGKQQSVSGWSSGWRKLGRLGKISGANENDEERMAAAAAPGGAVSKGPTTSRRRRNSTS